MEQRQRLAFVGRSLDGARVKQANPAQATWPPRLGVVLLILATALPVLFLKTPPMVDVLGHIGRYTLQTGLAADPWLRQWYAFEWQVIGNLGADLLVQLLHPLLGVLGAARAIIALVPLLGASAIVLLSRQVHGRVTPFAVASLPLLYALPFSWGFLNFSLSMALALLAFTLWLRLGPGARRVAVFAALSLALWLCHTFGWAFLGILCTGESLARRYRAVRSPLRTLLSAAADCGGLLAPLAPMLLWRSTASGAGVDGWFDWMQKGQWLVSIQRLDWQMVDLACAAILLALPFLAITSRVRVDARIGLAAGFALAAFFLLPKQIFGSVFADMRLAPYAVLLALLALRDDGAAAFRRVLMVGALAFLGLRLALTAHVYHDREREVERHLAALDAIPPHARVAMLVEVPCQTEWALPWFSHIGSLALTRKSIFVNDQWANASMNPLHVRLPQAGPFATDDKQLFFPERCGMRPTVAQALKALPLRAFTHVWVVGPRPSSAPGSPSLSTVWRGRDSEVMRVTALRGQVVRALGSSQIFRVNQSHRSKDERRSRAPGV